jgi:hypothetical protein
MWRSLLRWFAPLFVSCFGWLPAALADAESDVPRPPNYAFPYTVAFLALIIMMVIVCVPSRKR